MKITGTDALGKALLKRAESKDIQNVVKLNGAEMQRKAQRNAPVDTGNLKRSISLEITDSGNTAVVESGTNYSAYQEYGTRFISGTPHIRPAFYEQRQKFISDLRRLME